MLLNLPQCTASPTPEPRLAPSLRSIAVEKPCPLHGERAGPLPTVPAEDLPSPPRKDGNAGGEEGGALQAVQSRAWNVVLDWLQKNSTKRNKKMIRHASPK